MKAFLGVVVCWVAVLCTLMLLPSTKWVVSEQFWFLNHAPQQGEHFPTVTIDLGELAATRQETKLINQIRNYLETGQGLIAVREGLQEIKDSPVWLSSAIRQGFSVRPPFRRLGSKPFGAELVWANRYNQLLQEFASTGAKTDPSNSFWLLTEASACQELGQYERTLALLKEASTKKLFRDYGLDRVKALSSGEHLLSGRGKATLYASETYPHFAWILRLVEWARSYSMEAKWYTVAIGTNILDTADVSIGVLAGGWIVRQTLAPGSSGRKGVPPGEAIAFDRATHSFHPDTPNFTLVAAAKVNKLQKAEVFTSPSDLDTALAPWPALLSGAMVTFVLGSFVLFGFGAFSGRFGASATGAAVSRHLVWLTLPLCATAWGPRPEEAGVFIWAAACLSIVCLPFAAYEKTRTGTTILGWVIAAGMLAASFTTPLAAIPVALWVLFPWLRNNWAGVQWPWIVVWPLLMTFAAIATTRANPWPWLLVPLVYIGVAGVSTGWSKKPFPPVTLPVALGLIGYLVCVNWQVQNDKSINAMIGDEATRAQKLREKISVTE